LESNRQEEGGRKDEKLRRWGKENDRKSRRRKVSSNLEFRAACNPHSQPRRMNERKLNESRSEKSKRT